MSIDSIANQFTGPRGAIQVRTARQLSRAGDGGAAAAPPAPAAQRGLATASSAKKKRDSRSAFSSESEAWIAFRSLDSANSLRTVFGAASAGSVAPMTLRSSATAFGLSSSMGMHGPDVMNDTSDL